MERNIEALEQLKRVVADAPEGLFVMNRWSTYRACGTAHCAAGWAAVDPWFKRNTDIGRVFVETAEDFVIMTDDWEVMAAIFGITEDDANRLFAYEITSSGAKATKADVIANIDRLIAGEAAVSYVEDE